MERQGIIYMIRHRESGMTYIGQTKNTLERRWAQHRWSNSSLLSAAVREFGRDAFDVSVLATAPLLKLNELERAFIAEHDCIHPKGLNHIRGSTSVRPYEESEELRARRSASARGRPLSDEHRKKVAEANRRRASDPDIRAKISAAKKGKPISEATLAALRARKGTKFGPCSPERALRISLAKKAAFAARKRIGVFA